MTKKFFLQQGIAQVDAVCDCPFDGDTNSTILRHQKSRKWFALVYERDGAAYANLKCEPMQADFWRSVYAEVTPAWHMNKTHWNTVRLDGSVPDAVLCEMLADSYALTAAKPRKATPRRKSTIG